MPKSKYFFINKDASSDSLTQSSGLQRSAIQKHVQRGLVQKGQPGHSITDTDIEKRATIVDDKALYNVSIRALTCKLDAFNCASVYIDRTVRVLLDYYIYYYHPMIWNYDPFSSPPLPYTIQSEITLSVRTALQDPLAMNCLLSSSASRMINVDGFPFPGSPEREHHFMQQALTLMRGRIIEMDAGSEGSIDDLVECMMFLCSAELYRDNYPAAWAHLKGVLKFLESKGGIAFLRDTFLLEPLIQADLAISATFQVQCLCPCESYDPGPASTLAMTDAEFRSIDDDILGSRLLCKGADILPLKMKALVWAILDSYVTKRGLNLFAMTPARAFETTCWVQKRNMAIRNNLLAITTSDHKIQALRTALIMWTLLTMNLTGRLKTVKVIAPKLRSILDGTPAATWNNDGNDNEDVKLWILLVGHSCSREGSESDAWFAEQVRRLLKQKYKISNIWTRDYLLQFLINFQQGFFYDEPVQRSRTKELADWISSWEDMTSI